MLQAIGHDQRSAPFCQSGVIGMILLAGMFSGCAVNVEMALPESGGEAEMPRVDLAQIKADPMAFFQRALAETQKIKTMRMKFQRQERLGLFNTLQPIEHMDAEYRDKPFSVRFTWTDEKSEYRQCTYVEGENENRVALLPRHGFLGLPPTIGNYSPKLGVTFQKTRNPITDFGPRRLMERTIDRIEKAGPFGETRIRLMGTSKIGPAAESCYHFELVFPQGDEFAAKLQDLYIHEETYLPVATYVWMNHKKERSRDTLVAMYIYGQIEPNVSLADDTFVIDIDKQNTSTSEHQKAHRSEPGPAAERVGSLGESNISE